MEIILISKEENKREEKRRRKRVEEGRGAIKVGGVIT